ncbi:MAG: preprotein translocase subunit TatB [Clostridiales bacterium]|nr:preprotein translocase subunit TatB [Clostridiales bacterium]
MSQIIDARGRACPEPVILVSRAYEGGDSLTVLVDNICAVENINRFCENRGGRISFTEEEGDYTLTLTK